MKITKHLRTHMIDKFGMRDVDTDEAFEKKATDLIAAGQLTAETFVRLQKGIEVVNEFVNTTAAQAGDVPEKLRKGMTLGDIFDDLGDDGASTKDGGFGRIRVKDASERYSSTKSIGMHSKTGAPVQYEGRLASLPSEQQLARVGVWFKSFQIRQAQTLSHWGMRVPTLNEHEKQLLAEMQHKGLWSGQVNGNQWVENKKFSELGIDPKGGLQTKAPLINDGTSGGSNLVPFDFDEAVVTFPLLHGELFPFVDNKGTNRDQVQTASFSNPSVTWNTAEGTSLSPFDATSMIANISQSVYPVSVAIEYGADLESDSPVDIGTILVQICGAALTKELDDVIQGGDGSTQPEGILTATGTGTANSDNGSTGPWTVADAESLLFGIGKQYRRNEWNPTFLSNDTTYQRWRSVAVGSGDQRLVYGMDVESYRTFMRRHAVQNDIGNATAAFVALKKYRMWRRSGFEVLLARREGRTLALQNLNLLVVRGRWAGQLVDANACVKITDGQS